MAGSDRRPTASKRVDLHGVWHEVVWQIGVAYVLRCTGELPVHMRSGSILNNPTTCLLCLGASC